MGRLRHPSPALVVACLALVVSLAGTGYAAVRLPANSVGTKQLKNNAVVAAKVKAFSLLRSNFKIGQIPRGVPGPQGPTGLTGAAGAKGDKGDSSPKLFATVKQKANAAGAELGTQSGFDSLSHTVGSNLYTLSTTSQSLANCAVLAVPNAKDDNDTASAANATVTGDRTVTIQTFEPNGSNTELNNFTVAVFC